MKRQRGAERLYPDAVLVPLGVSLHPSQADFLHRLARERGVSFATIVRQALDEWAQQGGGSEQTALTL